MNTTLIIVLVIVALILIWGVATFNSLVAFKNRVKNAWKDIDVQLKRRADLIGNLVETVKGYAGHEKGIFDKFAEARNAIANASTVAEAKAADQSLGSALAGMRVIQEQYPELKANENFTALQTSIEATEDKLQGARRFYNAIVTDYNIKIESFPSNVIAGLFKFTAQEQWDSGNQEELDKGLNTTDISVKF